MDGSSESLDSRLVRQGYAVWSANSPVVFPGSTNDAHV
ncbi:unnamed protein product [Toxocara canis]|uniref:Uncharacterized protein n=1 Tax=Toxocara canis TaxID=6265 RepID=A0A3P7G5A4_TOXCA|nr:unnamed protein product [Toxocara canis]